VLNDVERSLSMAEEAFAKCGVSSGPDLISQLYDNYVMIGVAATIIMDLF
jgi:hypothetical protein